MGSLPVHSVEVTTKEMEGLPDARGDSVRGMLSSDYGIDVGRVKVTLGYLIKADLQLDELERTVYDLFADPIIEHGTCSGTLLDSQEIFPEPPEAIVQVGFKPGVTDNAGQAGLDGLTTLFPAIGEAQVAYTRTYMFWRLPKNTTAEQLATPLHNPMIERCVVAGKDECASGDWPSLPFPDRPPAAFAEPAVVNLEVSDEELLNISEKGLLALNLEEMQAIQAHYQDQSLIHI